MKKRKIWIRLVFMVLLLASISFTVYDKGKQYEEFYTGKIADFVRSQELFLASLKTEKLDSVGKSAIAAQIEEQRKVMKSLDFWLRYLEPTIYKKINGPLPVEWETEVFEKYEKPYRREGAGYTLARLYLDEDRIEKDSLFHLISSSLVASKIFLEDSIREKLSDPGHFYFCNRLFLLNLAAIYTTGFDCPDPDQILPELKIILKEVGQIYAVYNSTYPEFSIGTSYLKLFGETQDFLVAQSSDPLQFDHYRFLREYINPLFATNQQHIRDYGFRSKSLVDYSLNKNVNSIFDKSLYLAQNPKGAYRRIQDPKVLEEIASLGKLLFYDPILSVNNQRSCASCHQSGQAYTDTSLTTHLQLNGTDRLSRNSPSLLNGMYNHLIMLDGKQLTLQDQVKAVISNSLEMGESPEGVLKKVLDCKEYRSRFGSLVKHMPEEKEIRFEHLASSITYYYSQFSKYSSPFDEAMNKKTDLNQEAVRGFNLFMGKAQCATCHFVPQFNGVKPPYVGSEFEVLGVPSDTAYKQLSKDEGRYGVNPAFETRGAIRTGSLRNIGRTAPYMHNGVFSNLNQVLEFYNGGGGSGRGLNVPNQTLSEDSLRLTAVEKKDLIQFMESLNEDIPSESIPGRLPLSKNKTLNTRIPGGTY